MILINKKGHTKFNSTKMKSKLLLSVLLAFIGLSAFAQEQKIVLDESKKLGAATKSEMFTLQCLGELNTPTADLKWKPILTNKCISFEPKSPNYELIEQIKTEKLRLKQEHIDLRKVNTSETTAQIVTPVLGANWLGNVNSGSSPMDNNIAISNGGIIVSVANTTIEIDDVTGNLLYYNDISTFFNDPSISNACDPVVLYDVTADRFIFFFQECSGNSANSYLCICFSKTNNPATGGWWKYKVTGNPLNDNSWFDYPKMAISNNELYITGNLFNNSSNFNQAILYQIQKAAGYSGGNLSWQYWNNIAGSPFTLCPLSHGQTSYGPGCYLVATSAGGGSTVQLYDLTDDMTASNEQLNYYSISTTAYSPAADAGQLGTTCLLDNGDCRMLSGFYLNGIVHFVFHSDIGNGWNGINYNRLTLSTSTNQSSVFGLSGTYDYSYPSLASYATTISDKSVMIGFGRSSSAIYPEVRVVNCDDAMNWSPSTLVKSSSTFVGNNSQIDERWGDYTGTVRKHNSSNPAVWMNGMYGNSSNSWNTWIAEIYDNSTTGMTENMSANSLSVFPNPVVETFSVEFTLTESANLEIGIFDISGKMVKELYKGKGLQGDNFFSFNKANLPAGTYFLIINNNSKTIKNEKIIIAN